MDAVTLAVKADRLLGLLGLALLPADLDAVPGLRKAHRELTDAVRATLRPAPAARPPLFSGDEQEQE